MNDFISKRQALFACLDNASHELKGTSLDQINNLEEIDNYRNALGVDVDYRQQHHSLQTRQHYLAREQFDDGQEMSVDQLTNIPENPIASQVICVRKNASVYRHLRGQKSIFKKPAAPIEQCLRPRKVPDFQVRGNFGTLLYTKISASICTLFIII